MQIHERIHIVGGGLNSFGLTHYLDCTVYLLDGKSSLALIDAGAGVEPASILEQIRRIGFDPRKIDKILLTHGHTDHSGGAAWLARQCGAHVLASRDTADFLNRHDLDAISLTPLLKRGVYPPGYQFDFCQVSPIGDGGAIALGDLTVSLLDLPGHCDGHAAYLLNYQGRKMLFSGDLAFSKGRISMQNIWDCRYQTYRQSLKRVHELRIDSLLTGHQAFCLNEAYRIFDNLHTGTTDFPPNL